MFINNKDYDPKLIEWASTEKWTSIEEDVDFLITELPENRSLLELADIAGQRGGITTQNALTKRGTNVQHGKIRFIIENAVLQIEKRLSETSGTTIEPE
jgi:hypothetical protein